MNYSNINENIVALSFMEEHATVFTWQPWFELQIKI